MKSSIAIKLLSSLALVVGLSGCKKTLEEYNPSGTTAESVYTTPEGYQSLVAAAYNSNKYWYGKEEGMAVSEMGTDIWTIGEQGNRPATSAYAIVNHNIPIILYNDLDPANLNITRLWRWLYSGVNLCNYGIKIAEDGGEFKPDQSNVGELKFLRAWYYWHIVETWGGVHFTTDPTTSAIQTANRMPENVFYDQIVKDLLDAILVLPSTTPTTEHGRVNSNVAKAFLARVYLTRGYKSFGSSSDFVNARDMAVSVISGGYSLVPNYESLWSMTNQKNSEVIWSVNYAVATALTDLYNEDLNPYGYGLDVLSASGKAGGANGAKNRLHFFFLSRYDNYNPGDAGGTILVRNVRYGRPFNRFKPTKYLLDLYDKTNDERYKGSFQTVWKLNKPIPSGRLTGKVINKDTALVIDQNPTLNAGYYTLDVNTTYDADGGTLKDGTSGERLFLTQNMYYPSLKKYQDSTRAANPDGTGADAQLEESSKDVQVIRLAEMYMIAAEAEFKLGNTGPAATYLNTLRDRAEITPGALDITAGDVTLDFILDERAREFAGENMRWFDLKRTGTTKTRIDLYNPDLTPYFNPGMHLVRPIPQQQMDAVTNKGEFIQNPGY